MIKYGAKDRGFKTSTGYKASQSLMYDNVLYLSLIFGAQHHRLCDLSLWPDLELTIKTTELTN